MLRNSACLTQGQLAEKAGMSQTLITRYETAGATPRPKTIEKLAAALNVPPELLNVRPSSRTYSSFEMAVIGLNVFGQAVKQDDVFNELYRISAPGSPEITLSVNECDTIYEACLFKTEKAFENVMNEYFKLLFLQEAYAAHAKKNAGSSDDPAATKK